MKTFPRASSALACLVLATLAVAAAQDAPAAPPVLPGQFAVAPEPVWDAGVIGRGETVRHTFVIQNVGTETLYLREVRPACGCTVVSYDEQILPGQTGKVAAELATEDFRGPIAKDVTVLTNDPSNPLFTLTIKGEVQPWVDAQPGYFRFVHVVGEPAPTGTQTVWSSDLPGLEITAAESPLPHLSLAVRPATEQERDPLGRGRQWAVVATLASDAPAGPLQGEVTLRTNHPRQPELVLPVAGFVKGVVQVSPPIADFGSFVASEPRRGSVIVTNHGSAPVAILGAETDVPGLTAQVAEREKGKRFDVNLVVAAGVAPGKIAGTLRVRTSSPQVPLLEVPVRGEVRQR
jgi:hypothetical protein